MSYVATKGKIGAGAVFSYSTNLTTPSYTVLAEVIGITPPKVSVDDVDASRFDSNTLSVDGGTNTLPIEDYIRGFVKPGEWKIKFVYDVGATVAAAIYALVGSEILCKLIREGTKGMTGQGFIKEYGEEIPLRDRMTIEITIKINGGSIAATV